MIDRILFKLTTLSMAVVFVVWSHAAHADDQRLEERVAELERQAIEEGERWFDTLSFSGLIEVEASYTDPDSGDSESDLVVATAALGAEANVADGLSAALVLLYEEDDTDLEVDVATMTYVHRDSGWWFHVGQDYLPFGAYSTALVNDPLTLGIGETRETAFIVNYEAEYFAGAFYVFNGDQDDEGRDQLRHYGLHLGFQNEHFAVSVDYISNLADSDGLQEGDYGFSVGEDVVTGASVYGEVELGVVSVVVEHVSALDELAGDANNSEPSATHIEVSVESGDFIYAIAYQQSDDAVFLGLSEERFSLGLSSEILGALGLGVELTLDDDYSVSDGGTGDATNSLVFQLSAEF